ncbi:hypothetical protein ACIBG0_41775 [Nocardia sp. NPDC050630]|uniref:hypothetical protein n=1 Tax=Nocardia sp. NPDC050630 TaxID=3364321 RepID=UPI003793D5E7
MIYTVTGHRISGAVSFRVIDALTTGSATRFSIAFGVNTSGEELPSTPCQLLNEVFRSKSGGKQG